MRMNESSGLLFGHARIIHLRPSRCDGAVNMALGYHGRNPCSPGYILPCEP